MPLAEVEGFLKQNRHLPGMAPAAEMQKDGIEVGEQQAKLLQKLEEMTLYIIDQEKKQESQAKLLKAQQELLLQLQQKLGILEQNA